MNPRTMIRGPGRNRRNNRKEKEERIHMEREEDCIAAGQKDEALQIENSYDEFFKAAAYLFDHLLPAYSEADSLWEDIESSRLWKKARAKDALAVFRRIADLMAEPISQMNDHLTQALRTGDTYPQEVYDAYMLFQKMVDKQTRELNAVISPRNADNEEGHRIRANAVTERFNDLIIVIKARTDAMR